MSAGVPMAGCVRGLTVSAQVLTVSAQVLTVSAQVLTMCAQVPRTNIY